MVNGVTEELFSTPPPPPPVTCDDDIGGELFDDPKSLNGITSGSVFKLLFDTLNVTVFNRCRFDPKCSEVLRDLVRQLPLPPPITILEWW